MYKGVGQEWCRISSACKQAPTGSPEQSSRAISNIGAHVMFGVIANALVGRGNTSARCWLPYHRSLAFSFSNSFLNDIARCWETAVSEVLGAAKAPSIVRVFRFVGAMSIPTRMAQTLTSNSTSASETNLGTCGRDPQTGREHAQSPIMSLLTNPTLCCPTRKPRFPIVLCHGLYGFDASTCAMQDITHANPK